MLTERETRQPANPAWCIGCDPDNCSGCGPNGLDPETYAEMQALARHLPPAGWGADIPVTVDEDSAWAML